MHKNIYHKYKAIWCFIIFINFASICVAGEAEDAINQIMGKASSADVAKANEGTITSQAGSIKPIDSNDIDAQLKQIEQNYKSQIDSCTNQQNQDGFSSDLSNHLAKDNKWREVNDIKELTDKNAPNRKKIKISKNDELLVAAENIKKSTIDAATGMVAIPDVAKVQSRVEDRILTCREAGDEVIKKCFRTLIIKATQPEDIKFNVELNFIANSYSGHHTTVDLMNGKIIFGNASNSSSRVINYFNEKVPGAQILSIRHIGSESQGHTRDVRYSIQQPTAANNFVYTCNIIQDNVGSHVKKRHKNNRNQDRGRVEKWEVVARLIPVLEEHWDNGECTQLEKYAIDSFCEGPATNLIGVGETRNIEGYPFPVTKPHWQEEHIYTCGGGSFANECVPFHNAGCSQIDSQCIRTKGPFCVEYLQTFNCGKKRIISNLTANGQKITIDGVDNVGANDGFEIEEFGNAIGQLSMLEEIKKNMDRSHDGTVLLFRGDRLTCDKDFGSDIKNCCNLKGVFRNIIGHKCPKEVEEILAPAVIRERRCHEVSGWHCIARYPGIKKCRKWQKSFCCFQSRLARIFQQIAHHQLSISWGSPESPNCGPLDPHNFSRLNFDDPYAKSLFKELIDEVTVNAQNYANRANAKLTNNEDLTNKVKQLQARVSSYYSSKTQSIEGGG